MSAVPKPKFSYAEYIAREETAEYKHEFFEGDIFAMTGGTPQHNTVEGNVFAQLYARLEGSGCRPWNSNQRVRIPANGLATYPDVSIVCGEPEFDPEDSNALNNPRVIIEVLSKSTERYNRGDKFAHYRQLQPLHEYVLIAQKAPNVERFARRDDGTWVLTVLQSMDDVLRFESIEVELTLAEIYRDVDFGSLPDSEFEADPES